MEKVEGKVMNEEVLRIMKKQVRFTKITMMIISEERRVGKEC